MKNTWRICPFLLPAFFLLCPVLHAAPVSASAKPLIVATTIFPLADIVRNITGKTARVIQILPAGASPHTFDLTPGKIGELQKAGIVFKIGIIDDWIDSIAESAPNVPIVSLQTFIPRKRYAADAHDHGHSGRMRAQDFDPHYWLDARNGAIMAQQVCSRLSALAPQHAAVFMQNSQRYQIELLRLDRELKKACSALKNRKLIVFHDGWNYFAAACGLEIIAVFQPAPGRDPAPRDLQKLYALAKTHGIKAVFSEPQLPTASLEPLLEDLGLRVFDLDPLGGASPGDSYIGLLRRNVQSIIQADVL
jgi:ABC-type Zn uptake system ZnuABC Zn-binding protein ZnuA